MSKYLKPLAAAALMIAALTAPRATAIVATATVGSLANAALFVGQSEAKKRTVISTTKSKPGIKRRHVYGKAWICDRRGSSNQKPGQCRWFRTSSGRPR